MSVAVMSFAVLFLVYALVMCARYAVCCLKTPLLTSHHLQESELSPSRVYHREDRQPEDQGGGAGLGETSGVVLLGVLTDEGCDDEGGDDGGLPSYTEAVRV